MAVMVFFLMMVFSEEMLQSSIDSTGSFQEGEVCGAVSVFVTMMIPWRVLTRA